MITFATGGRPYYPAGILLALAAAGAVVTEAWLRTRTRRLLVTATLVVAAALGAHLPAVRADASARRPADPVRQQGRGGDDRLAAFVRASTR